MSDNIQCEIHGERQRAFVCHHLLGVSAGLGFCSKNSSADDPYPDAWCDDCELIRAAHGGWNDESEKLTKISVICRDCYDRVRIRNTRTSVTLEDLATLRWKCSTCEEWHYGPCLDFGYDTPYYWRTDYEPLRSKVPSPSDSDQSRAKYFLDEDLCQIQGDFFIRGLIRLPIIGTAKHFCWGVWGSLSRANFERLLDRPGEDGKNLPEMFSFLSTQITEYPDTLNLKMYAHFEKSHERPSFELEPTDHPLSIEYHRGISPERVKEIMLRRLGTESQSTL